MENTNSKANEKLMAIKDEINELSGQIESNQSKILQGFNNLGYFEMQRLIDGTKEMQRRLESLTKKSWKLRAMKTQ